MSLKEFDAKQFLLEKGEQAGLGVAVTLMVLMLIFSLFMPSKGFFSGSPAAKARELNKSTDDLAYALDTREPGPSDKPEERGKGKLIDLDTGMLAPDNYATDMWFEPRLQEDKSRRPPDIYQLSEAVAEVARVPIDIYVMRFGAAPKIMVLEDKDKAAAPGGAGGMMNPFSRLGGGRSGGSPSMPPGGGMPGGGGSMGNYLSQMRNRGNLGGLGNLVGVGEKPEYKTSWISLDDWNPQQLTAHAILPMRMTIIAASFPYKKQLEEHQLKLRLKGLDEVLNESIGEGEKQSAAFDFRGLDVERQEVDADGKVIKDWAKLPLEQSYQVLLEQSFLPFQPENPKYELVRPNGGAGLVMPLLREFRADKLTSPGLPGGFMPPGMGGLPLGGQTKPAEAPAEEDKSRYPDVADKLATIKKTLDDLHNAEPKQIAAPKFQKPKLLSAFNPQAAAAADNANTNKAATTTGGETLYPEHVLVRVVDVTVEPGKHYRYRLKMKMANPNYQNANVASPEYKEKEVLESKEWKELEQIVSVPQETYYYVVDEMQGVDRRLLRTIPPESAQYRLLNQRNPSADQAVAFQFHRWVESTRQSRKDTTVIPVGEWAVADRVFVTRGEYVGRPVNVDLPVWKYNQNGFILPVEDQKVRPGRRTKTGIDVDFGQEPLENNMILVDFEGGRGLSLPNSKAKDDCAIEVLMLSPDGKLLARNSTKDINDKERKDRREEVLKHILEIRAGK